MGIAKNYFYNTLLQLSNIIIPFITVPYITRVLDPSGIGIVSFSNSIIQYFILLATLGMGLYGSRTIAYSQTSEKKLNEEFWALFNLKTITSILSIFLYIIFLINITSNHKIIYYIQLINLISAFFNISYFFTGIEDFKKVSIIGMIVRILTTVLIFLIIKKPSDYILYALISILGNIVSQIILWFYLPKYIKFKKINLTKIIYHLKGSLKLFMPMVAIQIYTVLDKTMIGILSTKAEVGYYTMSQRLIKILLSLVTSIGIVMMPRISNLISSSNHIQIEKYSKKVFDYITYMSVFIIIMVIVIIPDFVPLYFGDKFLKVKDLIRIISPIILFISWSNFFGIQLMVPMKMEKYLTMSVIAGSIVNFLLNFLLISKYASIGASISTVISEFLVTIIQLLIIKKIINIKLIFSESWKHLISGSTLYVVLKIFSNIFEYNIIVKIILEVFIGSLIYTLIEKLLKNTTNEYILKKVTHFYT